MHRVPAFAALPGVLHGVTSIWRPSPGRPLSLSSPDLGLELFGHTLPELEALAHRWQTVLLLDQGVPYVEIAGRVPTSTATVTRVAQWLKHGTGGYGVALDRVKRKARR